MGPRLRFTPQSYGVFLEPQWVVRVSGPVCPRVCHKILIINGSKINPAVFRVIPLFLRCDSTVTPLVFHSFSASEWRMSGPRVEAEWTQSGERVDTEWTLTVRLMEADWRYCTKKVGQGSCPPDPLIGIVKSLWNVVEETDEEFAGFSRFFLTDVFRC